MIAKVEPLTSARALRGPFDYRLPAGMEDVGVGSVLVVPFGARRILGVVVDVARGSELAPEKLVEPLDALEVGVPVELVSLGLWVAEEYCSTPARGLSLVLPPGTGTGSGARPRVRGKTALEVRLRAGGSADGRLGERQRAILEALAAGPLLASELTEATGAAHTTIRRLEEKGLVSVDPVAVRRRPDMTAIGARSRAGARLTRAQESALEAVIERMDGERPERRLLLHGVTGSGKTEVYLRAAAAALERRRSCIVLVPEIALTPQTVTRFRERFGDTVAVLHSGLAEGERYDEWVRMRRGEARICVGPRSAVFAPLSNLGLLVIDEEHDPSYKQDGDPRYDARRVAERRAALAGAVLVAGSATPRPESRFALERCVLPDRVDGRELPEVELVRSPASGAFHPATRAALEGVRERREKAIVLLNRRGWSNFLTCGSCGHVWGCPQCDVTLVLHRGERRVRCHHCGHCEPVPPSCPGCGSISVARHGAGTEKLEAELLTALAPTEVFRLDADSAAAAGGVAAVLERFERAESGVLVGTQMVAKGHDFPDVTLAAVLDADATLRFPDFRAEERTFALVAQLAGRSGRGPRGGRVIVQALDPDARPLAFAARHDADGFLASELERRELLSYPPFGNLIRVVLGSAEQGPELEAAAGLRDAIDTDGVAVLGPAPLFRLKGRHRAQVVVKSRGRAGALARVRAAVEHCASRWSRRGVSFAVDVDPQ